MGWNQLFTKIIYFRDIYHKKYSDIPLNLGSEVAGLKESACSRNEHFVIVILLNWGALCPPFLCVGLKYLDKTRVS
jgi:hypothetical protein